MGFFALWIKVLPDMLFSFVKFHITIYILEFYIDIHYSTFFGIQIERLIWYQIDPITICAIEWWGCTINEYLFKNFCDSKMYEHTKNFPKIPVGLDTRNVYVVLEYLSTWGE